MAVPRVAQPVRDAGDGDSPPTRRPRWGALASRLIGSRVVRWCFATVAVGLAAYALTSDWTRIRAALAHLGLPFVVLGLVAVLLSYGSTVEPWRLLVRSMGSRLSISAAAKIILIGNLGKYVPGVVSSVVAPMELARTYRVPRARSASSLALNLLMTLVTGLLAAIVTLPFVAGSLPYWWALLVVPVLLVLLHPRVLNAIIGLVLRIARQPALEQPLTVSALVRPMAWSVASWVFNGLQIWILAVRLGAPPGRTALLAIGAYAFAWSVGFLIVFAPAGAGVRDVLLFALLRPVLGSADATAVVVASRLITILADLLSAAGAWWLVRPPPPAPVNPEPRDPQAHAGG